MEVLSCLLPSTFRKNGRDEQPSFSFFIFQTLQGITGVMIIIVMSVIYVFASQRSRRRQHRFGHPINYPFKNPAFRLFWTTHMLYPLFFFLLCIHGLQVFSHMKLATSMLVTDVTGIDVIRDVGDEMCWWQLWDVVNNITLLVTTCYQHHCSHEIS